MKRTAEGPSPAVESSRATAHCGAEHDRDSRKGHWFMILCCLAPLLILGGARLAGLRLGGVLAVVAMLACPAMLLLMMRGTRGAQGGGGARDEQRQPPGIGAGG